MAISTIRSLHTGKPVDSIFEKTTTPLTYWFYAIYLQTTTRNGVAAKELERQLNVSYKTALRMSHQIKKLMADKVQLPFDGIVEADETFLGGRLTNMSNKKRAEIAKIPFKSSIVNKTTVFGMLERNGKVYTKVVTSPTKDNIEPVMRSMITDKTKIFTDSSTIYKNLKTTHLHEVVNHQFKEYVRGEVHTNNIESFWSQLKRTIKGTHIHVSLTHLQKYYKVS